MYMVILTSITIQHTLYIISLLRTLVPVLSSIRGQVSRPSSSCGMASIGSKAKIQQRYSGKQQIFCILQRPDIYPLSPQWVTYKVYNAENLFTFIDNETWLIQNMPTLLFQLYGGSCSIRRSPTPRKGIPHNTMLLCPRTVGRTPWPDWSVGPIALGNDDASWARGSRTIVGGPTPWAGDPVFSMEPRTFGRGPTPWFRSSTPL